MAVTSLGGEGPGDDDIDKISYQRYYHYHKNAAAIEYYIPVTIMLAEAVDGLLLATVQVYPPSLVTVRV